MYIEEDNSSLKVILQTPEGRKGDLLTKHIIASKVDATIYKELISGCKTAKEMWTALRKDQVRLFNLDMSDSDVEDSDSCDVSVSSEGTVVNRKQLRSNQKQTNSGVPCSHFKHNWDTHVNDSQRKKLKPCSFKPCAVS